MIIDENQLWSAHNIWVQPNFNKQQEKQPPTTIDQNGYWYKLAPISALGNGMISI